MLSSNEQIRAHQYRRLASMLEAIWKSNQFYRARLRQAGLTDPQDLRSLDDLARLPMTTKRELIQDQEANPPFGTNLTYPIDKYIRLHETSGTTGRPLAWLDTEASWSWWRKCWRDVYAAAGVGQGDRIFFAFSFGPFIGFWSAFDAAQEAGCMAIASGGASSKVRLDMMRRLKPTVLLCTPTYALRLIHEAVAPDGSPNTSVLPDSVRVAIHAGEPGASIPSVRERIQEGWKATCFDHYGLTEVGAIGFECQAHDGMHLNEDEFICEVIDPHTNQPATSGELVVTNLGRVGMPLIRYRTGDAVKLNDTPCACGRPSRRAMGGILGRVDDMFIIRGVNVWPSSIDSVVREIPEIREYMVDIETVAGMDELTLRIEVSPAQSTAAIAAVQDKLETALKFRSRAIAVPPGTLAVSEFKGRRINDKRKSARA